MYETSLDASRLAASTVDAIRETTDAPLEQCHSALLAVLHLLEPHLKSSAFNEIRAASVNYSVDVSNCYDRRSLESICSRLFEIFVEKQELSFSSSQDDVELIKGLELFSDITRKTDSRIPMEVVSLNDYEWITQLVVVMQMDQNVEVRQAVMDSLMSLIVVCQERILRVLVESSLSSVLVSIISGNSSIDEMSPTKKLQTTALRILALIYSTDMSPPIVHFDLLNQQFFIKLLRSLDYYDGRDVLQLLVNVVWLLHMSHLSTRSVLDFSSPDLETALANLGQVLISEVNQEITERRLKFLLCLFDLGIENVRKIFYSNDLDVLARVLAREMVDRPEQNIRNACRDGIQFLINCGVVDSSYAAVDDTCQPCES